MTFLNKTLSSDVILPKYSRLITESILLLDDERVIATIKIKGVSYQTASDRELENYFTGEKRLFSALCRKYGSKLAVWTHIVRRKDGFNESYEFENEFIQDFSNRYCDTFSKGEFYSTDYYLTFVLKFRDLNKGIEELNDIMRASRQVFDVFNSEVLSIRQGEDGRFNCDNLSFLGFLLNNYFPDIPFSSDKAIYSISKSDLRFGFDTLEIRNHETDVSKFAVLYDLDIYTPLTSNGMWDFILNLQQEFIICQSMIFISSSKTLKVIDDNINLLSSLNDSETDQLDLMLAKDGVQSGEVFFGDYHASIISFGNSVSDAIENGSLLTNEFLTANTTWTRSNLQSIYTLQSIMPASKVRPISSPRTIANLVSGWSLHNNSGGKKENNALGDGRAIMPLKTINDTLYYFNCHAGNLLDDDKGKPLNGHTLILGASGTGKTTLEASIVAFLTRFNPSMFVIDYQRSTELYVRVFDGAYFYINEGESIGLNPFQLDDSSQVRAFLYELVGRCASDFNQAVSIEDELLIKRAVDIVMSNVSLENRRFSVLLQSIPKGTSLRSKLSKWCESENGQLAWALDAPFNKFNPKEIKRIGFDATVLIENTTKDVPHAACEPVLATLFFIKELMQRDGVVFLTIIEEFWCPANFPLTQKLMKKILKAARMKKEFMILTSQSPEDAIKCEIFDAIIQQTATKILLPNPDADVEGYKKIGLTEKEIKGVLELGKHSRTFLIKQSNDSVFAKLDLYGFDDVLAVISCERANVYLCERIREILQSDEVKDWFPVFNAILKKRKEKEFNIDAELHRLALNGGVK